MCIRDRLTGVRRSACKARGAMTSSPAPSADAIVPTSPLSIRPGESFPLGATWDGRGTNFAVFSEVAEAVDLCLFDLSLIHISEPTRQAEISYAVFCLKKK